MRYDYGNKVKKVSSLYEAQTPVLKWQLRGTLEHLCFFLHKNPKSENNRNHPLHSTQKILKNMLHLSFYL